MWTISIYTKGDGNVTANEFVDLWKALTGQTTELANAYFHLADLTDDKVINHADYGLLYHVFDLNSKIVEPPREKKKKKKKKNPPSLIRVFAVCSLGS